MLCKMLPGKNKVPGERLPVVQEEWEAPVCEGGSAREGSERSMRLFRFGQPDQEKPGVLLDGRRVSISAFGEDYDEAFFAADGVARLRKWIAKHGSTCPVVDQNQRVAACVSRPSKIVCVGLNYHQHALETGMEIPKEPVLFLKATTALAGANDDVVIPPGSEKVDWEAGTGGRDRTPCFLCDRPKGL